MATVTEMLTKKTAHKKPFKKVAYKPWENTFIEQEFTEVVKTDELVELNPDSSLTTLEPVTEEQNISETLTTKASSVVIRDTETEPKIKHLISEIEHATSIQVIEEHKDHQSHRNLKNVQEIPVESNSPIKTRSFRINSVLGIQLSILIEITRREEDRDGYYLYSEPMSTAELSEYCKSQILSVNTALYRLKKKGLLKVTEAKRGRGGYSVYAIPMFVFEKVRDLLSKSVLV